MHDACFLPRASQVTGDIGIHEIAYARDELWIVSTRFSCLGTLDPNYSFVPRWRPPFVSALAAEDRCHLNGLAVVEGRPAYVTALGSCRAGSRSRSLKIKSKFRYKLHTLLILLAILPPLPWLGWTKYQAWRAEQSLQNSLTTGDEEELVTIISPIDPPAEQTPQPSSQP